MDNKTKEQIEQYLDQDNIGSAQKALIEALQHEAKDYEKESLVRPEDYLALAHYTSVEAIYSILHDYKRRDPNHLRLKGDPTYLRLYDAASFNDPSEGGYLKNKLEESYTWLKDAAEGTEAYICSFVSDGDEKIGDKITYWQSYGRNGLGCSIQFSQEYVKDNKKIFHRVLYGRNGRRGIVKNFKDYFELGGKLHNKYLEPEDKRAFATAFWKAFDKIKFLYKHDGYKYERELRIVNIPNKEEKASIKNDFKSSENPYLRSYVLDDRLKANNILTSGSKIFIGPRVVNGKRLCEYFRTLVKTAGFIQKNKTGPVIVPSDIPYR